MVDAGRVDDARRRVEALAVEAGGGLVQSLVVEGGGERALLEVAADDRHGVDRGGRRDAQAAQRRDQPAARRVGQRQVVDRGREDVGDLLCDQLLGRGHADVDRLREAADRRARLLAERRVRLVADHELVGLARDRVGVAGEPGVGLDRDRVLARRGLAALDRVDEAVAVALGRQVALELGDEQAAVGEDEDPERLCRLDEAGRGDRLAGRRRVAEAVAPHRAGSSPVKLRSRPRPRPPRRPARARPPPRRPRPRAPAPRGRCRSRSDPRPGAGSPRSARSASRRARRSGACAARCRRRSRAASTRARARARAAGRTGPSSSATARGGRRRARRAPRRARRDVPSRAPALRPDPRRGGGRALLPIPAHGARRRSAHPARPT